MEEGLHWAPRKHQALGTIPREVAATTILVENSAENGSTPTSDSEQARACLQTILSDSDVHIRLAQTSCYEIFPDIKIVERMVK